MLELGSHKLDRLRIVLFLSSFLLLSSALLVIELKYFSSRCILICFLTWPRHSPAHSAMYSYLSATSFPLSYEHSQSRNNIFTPI